MFARKSMFLVLSLGLLLAAALSRAQAPPPTESQVKSAFLYNFAKFIDWPPTAFADDKSPFIIGILGSNPIGAELTRTTADKRVSDRLIAIKTYRPEDDLTRCHILFISNSEKKRFPEILQRLRGTAVLTVGETDGFIEAGGMVNFVLEAGKTANKIRFQINDEAARKAALKISSKLLSLAIRSAR